MFLFIRKLFLNVLMLMFISLSAEINFEEITTIFQPDEYYSSFSYSRINDLSNDNENSIEIQKAFDESVDIYDFGGNYLESKNYYPYKVQVNFNGELLIFEARTTLETEYHSVRYNTFTLSDEDGNIIGSFAVSGGTDENGDTFSESHWNEKKILTKIIDNTLYFIVGTVNESVGYHCSDKISCTYILRYDQENFELIDTIESFGYPFFINENNEILLTQYKSIKTRSLDFFWHDLTVGVGKYNIQENLLDTLYTNTGSSERYHNESPVYDNYKKINSFTHDDNIFNDFGYLYQLFDYDQGESTIINLSSNFETNWENTSNCLNANTKGVIAIIDENELLLTFRKDDDEVLVNKFFLETGEYMESINCLFYPDYIIRKNNQKLYFIDKVVENNNIDVNLKFYSINNQVTSCKENNIALIPKISSFPNPFLLNKAGRSQTTTISFELPQAGKAKLEVFNIKGQKVKTIANRNFEKGKNLVEWNGANEIGKKVSSGVYFYKLKTEKNEIIRKMLLLK